jgi:tetratricopeptide (TPR) repeat protein
MRKSHGLSLRELSREATLDVGYLSKIENGRRPATIGVAKAVDRVLNAKGELIMIARLERSERVRRALPLDTVRRRSVLALGLGVPLAAGTRPAARSRRRKIGLADVKELQDTATWLYGLDHQHGGASLWRAANDSAQDGYAMLEDGIFGEVVEKRLLRATSRVQMCAGWLAFDAGRHELARSCYTDALALARQSGDAEVEVHALSNLAFQSNVFGHPREAMRFVEGAVRADSATHEQPRLSAIPQLRRSVALSLSRDKTGYQKAIKAARKVLDRDHDKPVAEWCAFFGAAELDGVEGTCLVELDQPRRAEILLERAITGYDDRYARNRALYRVRLARARIDLRRIDGAAEAANSVLDDLAKQVASWRVENELASVATELAKFPAEESVQRFLERYRATKT